MVSSGRNLQGPPSACSRRTPRSLASSSPLAIFVVCRTPPRSPSMPLAAILLPLVGVQAGTLAGLLCARPRRKYSARAPPPMRVCRMPGDGACLFHALAYCLGEDGVDGPTLRAQLVSFIERNPTLLISDAPLEDWIAWESGDGVAEYCRRLSEPAAWGGGIELAAASQLCSCCIHVYEHARGREQREQQYTLISSFDVGTTSSGEDVDDEASPRVLRLLYNSGQHYDALVV